MSVTIPDLVARRLECTEEQYHADPCDVPSLSSSLAKTMLSKSPLHAWHAHPRMGKGEREESKVFDHGQLVHKLVLGAGRRVQIIDADDWRTKAAREERDQARAANKIPALRDVFDKALTASQAITARLAKMGIILAGESEVAIAWQELSNRGPIWCRAMLDHVVLEKRRATIYEFKTTRSAHPSACARHVLNYGYDVQQAAYTSALGRLRPDVAAGIDFVFIFAETVPPYAVTPARLDDMLVDHGKDGWTRAVIDFGDGAALGEWPGYANDIVTLEAPRWLFADEDEDNLDANDGIVFGAS